MPAGFGAGRRTSADEPGPVVVGRRDELEGLTASVEELSGGRGSIVLIEGEPGIGKSLLVAAGAIGVARSQDIRVLVGQVHEVTAGRPFGLVAELVRDVATPELEALLQPTEAAMPPASTIMYRIADVVGELAASLTEGGPVLVVAEDVHDADEGSLLALHALVRRVSEVPLALVVTRRLHPMSDALVRWLESAEDAGMRQVRLAPLPAGDVRELVEARLGVPAGPRLMDLVERASGNPLFISELLDGVVQEGALTAPDDTAELATRVMPPSLAATVLRRLHGLDPMCRSLLRDAAVLGTVFRIDELALVKELDAATVIERLTAAFDAGFLIDDGRRAAFRHALVRDAIYGDISTAVRATLHRSAGRRLAAAGASAADVAHHLSLGASPGDLEAIEWLERAAGQAAPRAPGLAVERLHQAWSLVPDGHPARRRLLVSLTRCLLWSGRLDDAGEAARQVLALLPEPDEEAEARYVLGRVLVYQGDIGGSIQQVELALRDGVADGDLRGQLLADLALRRGLHGDLDGADDVARRALVAGQELGDPLTVCTARCALAWNAAMRGEAPAGISYAERAVRSPRRRDAVEPVQARLYLGVARLHAGDLSGARAVLEGASTRMVEMGASWGSSLARSLLALVGWLAGDWDAAASDAAGAVSSARAGAARTWLPLGCAAGALVAVSRGELDTAEELLSVGEDEVAVAGGRHIGAGLLGYARAELDAARGDRDASAQRRFAALQDDLDFGVRAHLPLHLLALPATAVECLDPSELRRLTAHADDLAGACGLPLATAAAGRLRGLADRDANWWRAALEALEHTEFDYHQARLAEEAAISSAAGGAGDEATTLAEQALAVYRDLGAVRDRDRCRARLREQGVRTGARGRRGRPRSGWESLTPSELRVAGLVAEGLSNPDIAERLFVSRRTVESHVSNALSKLGQSSRVQLALQVQAERDAEQE